MRRFVDYGQIEGMMLDRLGVAKWKETQTEWGKITCPTYCKHAERVQQDERGAAPMACSLPLASPGFLQRFRIL